MLGGSAFPSHLTIVDKASSKPSQENSERKKMIANTHWYQKSVPIAPALPYKEQELGFPFTTAKNQGDPALGEEGNGSWGKIQLHFYKLAANNWKLKYTFKKTWFIKALKKCQILRDRSNKICAKFVCWKSPNLDERNKRRPKTKEKYNMCGLEVSTLLRWQFSPNWSRFKANPLRICTGFCVD